MPSPFLTPGPTAHAHSLAILHLRRDSLIATTLSPHDDENLGYDEGKVTNTRFGSYPHSTLIGLPWGSQVRASAVDTGSRGRRKPEETLKRKAALEEGTMQQKVPVAASSGFAHLLPPTPESWTASLPHRTQVVYTPDYSYVLQRLRVRPGSVVIEAGAGSGSFTHAAARAVFNGYGENAEEGRARKKRKVGRVFSFEFHEQRVEKLKSEVKEHGLEGIVRVTHRDVYNDGFLCYDPDVAEGEKEQQGPRANAVFLDLPAPWLALPHLRRGSSNSTPKHQEAQASDLPSAPNGSSPGLSPLDPITTIHLCTFSPCLEQVQKTVSALRNLGWLEIEMVELAQRRIEVRRERVGLREEGLRGVNASAASVEEAIARLKEVESSTKVFHENANANGSGSGNGDKDEKLKLGVEGEDEERDEMSINGPASTPPPPQRTSTPTSSKRQRFNTTGEAQGERKLFKEGRLVHRSEPELKTHTSYLVFAILPREWTEEDEQECRRKWPAKVDLGSKDGSKSRKQMKREKKLRGEGKRRNDVGEAGSA